MNLKKGFICFFLFSCSSSENESLPIENTTTSVTTLNNSQNSSTQSLFCPPCQRNNDFSSYDDLVFPNFKTSENKTKIKVNTLTSLNYSSSIDPLEAVKNGFYDTSWFNLLINYGYWWTDPNNDHWNPDPDWYNKSVSAREPNLSNNFEECVDDSLRWKCGYSFSVELPEQYNTNRKYPLIVFLHGGVWQSRDGIRSYEKIGGSIYKLDNHPFIVLTPTKLEVDWNPKKIRDAIELVIENVSVDVNRIYLTGISMGGRGTFIVAAENADLFSALMPISPHHEPYSYLELANKVKDIPILISHGDSDDISSFEIATQMAEELKSLNAEIIFKSIEEGDHFIYDQIYSDSLSISWLMNKTKD